jgi:hypothetical protein
MVWGDSPLRSLSPTYLQQEVLKRNNIVDPSKSPGGQDGGLVGSRYEHDSTAGREDPLGSNPRKKMQLTVIQSLAGWITHAQIKNISVRHFVAMHQTVKVSRRHVDSAANQRIARKQVLSRVGR